MSDPATTSPGFSRHEDGVSAVLGYIAQGFHEGEKVPWINRYERGFREGVRVAYEVIGRLLEGAMKPCSCPPHVQAWHETIPGTSVCWRCRGTFPSLDSGDIPQRPAGDRPTPDQGDRA